MARHYSSSCRLPHLARNAEVRCGNVPERVAPSGPASATRTAKARCRSRVQPANEVRHANDALHPRRSDESLRHASRLRRRGHRPPLRACPAHATFCNGVRLGVQLGLPGEKAIASPATPGRWRSDRLFPSITRGLLTASGNGLPRAVRRPLGSTVFAAGARRRNNGLPLCADVCRRISTPATTRVGCDRWCSMRL